MTPSLRFMRQRTCLTRTLTRNPYLIGYTRHICHTRTLTCDPLPNRVKSSKAQLSNRDPHPCPCTNTDSHGAHCHTRTLSHDPFIGAKHGAAYARIGARKTGWRTRNNGRTRHSRDTPHPQDKTWTHNHYTPPTSTKHNQSHRQHPSKQYKSFIYTKPQQTRHTQPNHYQKELNRKNKFFPHQTTTNRRTNISPIFRTKTPPPANTTHPTNHRQYDRQPNSPRTPKAHKVKDNKQGGDFKRQTSSKFIDTPIPPMGKQRNTNPPISNVFMYQKEQKNNFTRPSMHTSSIASHCPNACSSSFNKNIRSSSRTPATIPAYPFTSQQRTSFDELLRQHNKMTDNNNIRTVYALPARQRNPYPRGSAKHTRRANINRNIRAHLRHDAQRCKDDATQLQRMQTVHDQQQTWTDTIHRHFYSALNNFHYWNNDRQRIEYDHALIFRWVKTYNSARSLIIDATGKLSDATITQMTNLLWTKAARARTIAANGTFTRNTFRWATPLNVQRMDHFRKHLANLTLEPITTPEYRFPLLNQLLMTRDEIDDADQVEIGNMAPPPLNYIAF